VPTIHHLDDKTLDRVRALLAKAESTDFPQEAEAFTVKAQELMARYGIDAAVMASHESSSDAPGQRRIRIEAPYASAKSLLLSVIANANRCVAVWSSEQREAIVFGFDVDLDAVELLFVSLHVQATSAMVAAGGQTDGAGRSRTRSFRHAFLTAFAARIGERLRSAADAAIADAEHEVGHALVPVLTERVEAVHEALRTAMPHVRTRSATISNRGGWQAGRAAADRATLHRSSGPGLTLIRGGAATGRR
jgi:hypothetical protein